VNGLNESPKLEDARGLSALPVAPTKPIRVQDLKHIG